MNHHAHTLVNGITGVIASSCAVITTFQTEIEWYTRMTGAVIGIVIGLITLANLIRGKK